MVAPRAKEETQFSWENELRIVFLFSLSQCIDCCLSWVSDQASSLKSCSSLRDVWGFDMSSLFEEEKFLNYHTKTIITGQAMVTEFHVCGIRLESGNLQANLTSDEVWGWPLVWHKNAGTGQTALTVKRGDSRKWDEPCVERWVAGGRQGDSKLGSSW